MPADGIIFYKPVDWGFQGAYTKRDDFHEQGQVRLYYPIYNQVKFFNNGRRVIAVMKITVIFTTARLINNVFYRLIPVFSYPLK